MNTKLIAYIKFCASVPLLAIRKFRRGILKLIKQEVVDLSWAGREYPASVKKISDYSAPVITHSKGILPSRTVSHAFEGREVYEISDAVIDPKWGEVYLDDGPFVIQSTPWHPYLPYPERRKSFQTQTMSNGQGYIRLPVWTYYHQVVENLPCYLYLRRLFPDALTLVPESGSEIARGILLDLGIPFVTHKKQVKVNKLYLVGQGRDSGFPHPKDVEVLRETILPLARAWESPRIVYVSRVSSSRSFSNEVELIQKLNGVPGVEVVELEKLSFLEQVGLFANASMIIGPHGAGLTNQLWMPPGSDVIEFADMDYLNAVFENLAAVLGHHHHVIFQEGRAPYKSVNVELVMEIISRKIGS
jgi:hypothetical protein